VISAAKDSKCWSAFNRDLGTGASRVTIRGESVMLHIEGFVIPVPTGNKQKYRDSCARMSAIFREYGATRFVQAWGVDLPDGSTTDFKRAVKATGDETVVLSWIIWPDKATCDEANRKMRTDERMQPSADMPFDMRRMIIGGFEPLFDSEERDDPTAR
jgi:uncharacterized protein YbaA (DUF1428 family)